MPPAITPRSSGTIIKTGSAGITLIELMVTLTIVAIMAAFAAPDLQLFVRNSTVRAATTELASALTYARSEAIKRGWPVTVCKSSSINATSPGCSTTAAWEDGWVIFVDKDMDGVVDTGDTALRVGKPGSDSIAITSSGTNFANRIIYLPTGYSNTNGCLSLTLGTVKRYTIISNTGRLRIDMEGCNDNS